MWDPVIVRSSALLFGQAAVACAVFALVTLAPPARGDILILSLSGERPGEIARWAIAHDAKLIGAGPVPHSLIVRGARGSLFTAALDHTGLLLTGSLAGCGEKADHDKG